MPASGVRSATSLGLPIGGGAMAMNTLSNRPSTAPLGGSHSSPLFISGHQGSPQTTGHSPMMTTSHLASSVAIAPMGGSPQNRSPVDEYDSSRDNDGPINGGAVGSGTKYDGTDFSPVSSPLTVMAGGGTHSMRGGGPIASLGLGMGIVSPSSPFGSPNGENSMAHHGEARYADGNSLNVNSLNSNNVYDQNPNAASTSMSPSTQALSGQLATGMLSELVFSSRQSISVPVANSNPFGQSCSMSLAAQLGLTAPQLAHKLIEKFVAAQGDNSQKNILVKEEDIKIILTTVREIFMSQPMLIETTGPVKICGDTHGQFYDLLRVFAKCGFPNATTPYLFLGDYVDRGKHSIETIIMLFCYKILYPTCFTLLRGNHECASINRQYGFFDDVKRRYNIKLFKQFTGVFDTMPICCVVSGKIICMHGGLSPDLGNVQLINTIARPCEVPHEGIMCDLLWSDPADDEDSVSGFYPSSRGVGWEFGPDMVEAFLDHVDMDLIVRAHQVQERGYGFYANRQLVTIFTAPGYCGEFDNDAAVMSVDARLQCSFTVIPPRQVGLR